jgi:hypothetical protein
MNNYTDVPPLQIVDGTEAIGDSLVKFNSNTTAISSTIDLLISDIQSLNDSIAAQNNDSSTSYGKILELAGNIDAWKNLSDTVANLTYSVSTLLTATPGGGGGGSTFTGGMLTSDLSGTNATFVGTVKADTFYGNGDSLTGAVNSTRAYVIFDGTGDPGIIDSSSGKWGVNYNINSITKDSTGIYTITFATPMHNPVYCYSLNSTGNQPFILSRSYTDGWDVNSIVIENRNLAGDLVDSPEISVIIFDTAV